MTAKPTKEEIIQKIISRLPQEANHFDAVKAVLDHIMIWLQGDDLAWAGADLLIRDPDFTATHVAAEVPGSYVGMGCPKVSLDSGGMYLSVPGEKTRKVSLDERDEIRDEVRRRAPQPAPVRDTCTYCGADNGLILPPSTVGSLRQGWDCHRGCGN